MLAYCGQCGLEVSGPYCINCGNPTALSQRLPTAAEVLAELHAADPIHGNGFYRTPSQVYGLTLVTFGIYALYYLIRGRKLAQRRLGKTEETYWTALKLLIPIYGVFYYFAGWSLIGDRVKVSGIRPFLPVAVLIIPLFMANILWRLPGPIWTPLYFFGIGCFAVIAVFVAEAERKDHPDYSWPRLTVTERVIGAMCTIFSLLALIGLFEKTKPEAVPWQVVQWSMVVSHAAIGFTLWAALRVIFGKLCRPRNAL